jgi:hypothetical protein
MTYGFWMTRKGKYFPVQEHGNAIISNPKKFGLDKKQIDQILSKTHYDPQSTSAESGRGLILNLAFEKGFIRIRGSGSAGFSFQFFGNPKQVVELILQDFGEEYFGPYTFVSLTDLKTGFEWKGNYQELKEQHMDGVFDNISSSKTTNKKDISYSGSDEEVRQQLRRNLVPQNAIFGEELKRKIRKILFK